MHPGVVIFCIVSSVAVVYGGYTLYKTYREHQQYDGYVRQYSDYEKPDDDAKDDDAEDDDDDRFTAVGSDYLRRRQEQLRNRRARGSFSTHSMSNSSELHLERSSYELDEFEKNLKERRRRLVAEQEMLDQAERDLVRRRDVLAPAPTSSDEERQQNQDLLNPIINSIMMSSPWPSNSSVDGDEPSTPTSHGANDDEDQSSATYSHLSEDDLQSQNSSHNSCVSYDMLTDDDFHSTA